MSTLESKSVDFFLEVGKRFATEFSRLDYSEEEFGNLLGTSRATIFNWKKKGTITADKLAAMATYGIDVNYVLTGNRQVQDRVEEEPVKDKNKTNKDNNSILQSTKLRDDFVLVPRYDVQASAGNGSVIHSEQVVDHLAFKRDWVINYLNVKPENLALINARGDSMEPAIRTGDLLLVNLDEKHIVNDDIYIINNNGNLQVKRIQALLNKTIIVKSDNIQYDPQIVKEEDIKQLHVVGQVIWYGRSL
jgi:phage repressor protein C with HTH and peptisase S24 domain